MSPNPGKFPFLAPIFTQRSKSQRPWESDSLPGFGGVGAFGRHTPSLAIGRFQRGPWEILGW